MKLQKYLSLIPKSLIPNPKHLVKILAGTVVIGGLVGAFMVLTTEESEAGWYNDNWHYRKGLIADNSGSVDSNKRVKFDIDTSALISAKMQADCGDSRFTLANGQLLEYYLDSSGGACNTISTDYWVLIPATIPVDPIIIYHYYGNPSADNGTVGAQFSQSALGSYSTNVTASEEAGKGPDAYWNLDEGYGTTANDSVATFNGTLFGSPTWKSESDCVTSNCLQFDGTDDYVDIGTGPTSVKSVSFWVRPNTTTEYFVDLNGSAYISTSSGTVSATGFTSPTIYVDGVVSSTITANTWHHITVTTGTGISASGLDIGRIEGVGYLQGFIDEVKLYPYARSAAEVKSDYTARGSVNGVSVQFGDNTSRDQLSDGLVGHWKMDENAGTTTSDSSGNMSTSSTFTGNVAWTRGKFGSGLLFDGTDDVVRIPESGATDLGAPTDSYSVSAWFNTTANFSTSAYIVAKSSASSTLPFSLYLTSVEAPKFEISDGSNLSIIGPTALNDGKWHHVVGVRNTATDKIYLYVDGVVVNSATDTLTVSSANNDDISIGNGAASYTTADFNGQIDDVRIYKHALEPSEVAALYNWAPGPVAHWKMDENTGTSLQDSSGNSKTGTFSSTPQWTQGKYGSSLNFDGVDDFVDIDILSSLSNNTHSYSAWFTIDDFSQDFSVILWADEAGSSATSERIKVEVSDAGVLKAYDDYTVSISSVSSTIVANTWYHVAVTYDYPAQLATLYLNGVTIGTDTSFTQAPSTAIAVGSIGRRDGPTTYDWDGRIDDVRIYNYVRTPGQIIEDMNGGHPLGGSPIGSTAGYWNFDEGYATTAYDASINENNLTLNSASWTHSGKFGLAWSGDGMSYLSMADTNDLDFGSGESMSISAWFRSTNGSAPPGDEYLLNKETSSAGYALWLTSGGEVRFGIDDDATSFPENFTESNKFVYDQTWHHVVGVADNTAGLLSIYVDGRFRDSSPFSATGGLSNSALLFVGDRDGADNADEFRGRIDELKIYRYAMGSEDVLIEYNRGSAVVLGTTSTTASDVADSSSERSYCPPGDSTGSCAPMLEFKLDEHTGTSTVYDMSGNGYNGDITPGSMTESDWVAGKVSSGLEFDGVDDEIRVTHTTAFDFGTSTAFTLSAWVKMTSSGGSDRVIFDTRTDVTNGVDFQYNDAQSALEIVIGMTGSWCQLFGSTDIEDGQWHHVVGVFKRNASCTTNDLLIYIDGVRDTTTVNLSTGNANGSINVGGLQISEGANTFQGSVDQIQVFNYALTDAQIAWNYDKGKPVAHYMFDECDGVTAYNDSRNGNNKSRGNNATIYPVAGGNTSVGTCSSGNGNEMWDNGTNGKINGSLDFDGNDDYAVVTSPTGLTITGSYTTSLWFKADAWPGGASYASLFDSNTGSAAPYYMEINSSDEINCGFHDGTSYRDHTTTTLSLLSSTWYHMTCVFDTTANTFKIYVNGNLIQSESETNDPSGTPTTLYFGRVPSAQYYNGKLDDVRVYKYPLTDEQVRNVFTGGAVRFD